MKAKSIVHINGQKYDAVSGKTLDIATSKTPTVVAPKDPPSRVANHAPKSLHHAHRAPAKSITLARTAVKKPKILRDIRHVPILSPATKFSRRNQTLSRVSTNPKIVHFAKIEPRIIDTTPLVAPTTIPDIPPPVVSRRTSSKAEHHIRHQLSVATAHQNIHHRTPRTRHRVRKAPMLASAVAVAVLVSGFIAYQSMPNLSVNLASEQAGISAQLPKYTPSGFSLSRKVAYSPGRVVISFKSNTDDRQYRIEQQTSNLSNAKLEEQIKSETGGEYQTFSAGSISIYFSNDSAKWTKDGVLFSLTGESGLSSSQIASIASSL